MKKINLLVVVLLLFCSLVGCNSTKSLITKDTENISKSMMKYFNTDYIVFQQGEHFDAKLVDFYKVDKDTFVYRFVLAPKYDEKTTIKKIKLESNIISSNLFDDFNEMGDQSSIGYIKYNNIENINSLCLEIFIKNKTYSNKTMFSEEEFEQLCSNIKLVITSNHKKEVLSFLNMKYMELPNNSDDEFVNDVINGKYHLRIWEYH